MPLLAFALAATVVWAQQPPGQHLNIEEVTVTIGVSDIELEISGWDFDFGEPLEVTLAGVPANIVSATDVSITATVPAV